MHISRLPFLLLILPLASSIPIACETLECTTKRELSHFDPPFFNLRNEDVGAEKTFWGDIIDVWKGFFKKPPARVAVAGRSDTTGERKDVKEGAEQLYWRGYGHPTKSANRKRGVDEDTNTEAEQLYWRGYNHPTRNVKTVNEKRDAAKEDTEEEKPEQLYWRGYRHPTRSPSSNPKAPKTIPTPPHYQKPKKPTIPLPIAQKPKVPKAPARPKGAGY